ncbi:MAG TPA: glycosyl transferase [Spirochaetia bacterium]|nr:glycosyl transferase [Spirochaetia bacterium]
MKQNSASKAEIFFSIIIPVKIQNDYTRRAIPFYKKQSFRSFEIMLVTDQKEEICGFENLDVRCLASGSCGPAAKRDLAAREARGKILCFIDDDAWPEGNWLSCAHEIFQKNEAAAGGPAVTPPQSEFLRQGSGLVFESITGGGGLSFRYRPWRNRFYVDDYPSVNLFVRRDLFLQAGGFNTAYWPGEDTVLCLELKKAGHRVLYVPELLVYHERRRLFFPHAAQVFSYGMHRGFFVKKFPETSARPLFFLPLLLCAGLVLGWAPGFLWNPLFYFWAGGTAALACLIYCEMFFRSKKIFLSFIASAGVFLTHFSYSAGLIRGLTSRRLKSRLRA